jgi:hypothetical protein
MLRIEVAAKERKTGKDEAAARKPPRTRMRHQFEAGVSVLFFFSGGGGSGGNGGGVLTGTETFGTSAGVRGISNWPWQVGQFACIPAPLSSTARW